MNPALAAPTSTGVGRAPVGAERILSHCRNPRPEAGPK